MKRTSKQIVKDLEVIRKSVETAKSLQELCDLTGLTYSKIMTSLSGHPVIKNRILKKLAENKTKIVEAIAEATKTEEVEEAEAETISEVPEEEKYVVICDTPALIDGYTSCLATRVLLPSFVVNTLERLTDDPEVGERAARALQTIHLTKDWATIDLEKYEVLAKEPQIAPLWRARHVVAMACHYASLGYRVTLKTRTAAIMRLAEYQQVMTVDFVKKD